MLPTRNSSRWTGGLYVGMFIKTLSYQHCTAEAAKDVSKACASISRTEGMEAHARTADVRLDKYGHGGAYGAGEAQRRAAMQAEGYTRGALSVDSKLA